MGRRLVTGSDDGTAKIWDVTTFALVANLIGHSARINTEAFSQDGGQILTSSDDGSARIWNSGTGVLIRPLIGNEGGVYSAAFSSDGTRAITASANKLAQVWETRTGSIIAVLGGHDGPVIGALFSSDGRTFATASHTPMARLWNMDSSATKAVLRAATGAIVGAFSDDGTRVATVSDDGTMQIWDGQSGVALSTLPWAIGARPIDRIFIGRTGIGHRIVGRGGSNLDACDGCHPRSRGAQSLDQLGAIFARRETRRDRVRRRHCTNLESGDRDVSSDAPSRPRTCHGCPIQPRQLTRADDLVGRDGSALGRQIRRVDQRIERWSDLRHERGVLPRRNAGRLGRRKWRDPLEQHDGRLDRKALVWKQHGDIGGIFAGRYDPRDRVTRSPGAPLAGSRWRISP